MSGYDDQGPPEDGSDRSDRPEPDVGSVAEEAAKLFGAVADMARQHGEDSAGTFSGLAGQAAAFAREVNEHIATEDPECRYCPVCRAVHLVRDTSPEVRSHLTSAAASLLQAAAGLLDSAAPPDDDAQARRATPERIDLDETRAREESARDGDTGSPTGEEDW